MKTKMMLSFVCVFVVCFYSFALSRLFFFLSKLLICEWKVCKACVLCFRPVSTQKSMTDMVDCVYLINKTFKKTSCRPIIYFVIFVCSASFLGRE